MKIDKIKVYSFHVRGKTEWLVLEIESDNGLIGLSELTTSNYLKTSQLIETLSAQLKKILALEFCNDQQIKEILEKNERPPNEDFILATTLSGIRSACSDIFSKTRSLSLKDYLTDIFSLSKCSSKPIPLYANINRSMLPDDDGPTDRSPETFKNRAQNATEDGFLFIKCAPFDQYPDSFYKSEKFIDEGLKRVSSIVKVLKNSQKLLIDCHSKFNLKTSIKVESLLFEKGVSWFEEPMNPKKNSSELIEIKKSIQGNLVGGEEFYGVNEFVKLYKTKALDILMPDIKYCGGVEEAIKIGMELNKLSSNSFSIHCPSGPISLLGSAHVTSALNTKLPLEHAVYEVPDRKQFIIPEEKIINGEYCLPSGLGLGVKLNLDKPHKLILNI